MTPYSDQRYRCPSGCGSTCAVIDELLETVEMGQKKMIEQIEQTWKVVFEGHYKAQDIKEGYKEPIGLKHMFTRGFSFTGKWMPHLGVSHLKSCANGAINEALKKIEDGGYITIEVKIKNP